MYYFRQQLECYNCESVGTSMRVIDQDKTEIEREQERENKARQEKRERDEREAAKNRPTSSIKEEETSQNGTKKQSEKRDSSGSIEEQDGAKPDAKSDVKIIDETEDAETKPVKQAAPTVDPLNDPRSLNSEMALEKPETTEVEKIEVVDTKKPTEEELLDPKKYIQKQTFHAICAFLHGYHFELSTDVDYKKDNRFDSWDKDRFADSFYQDAFNQEVRVKCKYCVTPDLQISSLRTKKFD